MIKPLIRSDIRQKREKKKEKKLENNLNKSKSLSIYFTYFLYSTTLYTIARPIQHPLSFRCRCCTLATNTAPHEYINRCTFITLLVTGGI